MKKYHLMYIVIIASIVLSCERKEVVNPVDVVLELATKSGSSRAYLNNTAITGDRGTMTSSGNTLGDVQVEYRYNIKSLAQNIVEIGIELKRIRKNEKDVRWNGKLQLPSNSSATFQPFEDVSMKITAASQQDKPIAKDH